MFFVCIWEFFIVKGFFLVNFLLLLFIIVGLDFVGVFLIILWEFGVDEGCLVEFFWVNIDLFFLLDVVSWNLFVGW